MRLWIFLTGLLLLVAVPADADYLELRRNANIYEEANRHSEQIGRLDYEPEAEQFIDLADPNLESGYYDIEIPGSDETGFVYRTLVRRFPGERPDRPDDPPDGPALDPATFAVHFIDVGTGDAAIIDMGEGEIIIDGGMFVNDLWQYIDERELVQGAVELVIVTHADSDHWKGLNRYLGFDDMRPDVMVTEFWEPGYDRECRPLDSYDNFITAAEGRVADNSFKRPLQDHHIPAATSGQVHPFTLPQLDGVTFTLLWSDEAPTAADCAYRINNASVVVKIEIEGHSFLFTGDANGKERDDLGPNIAIGHVEEVLVNLNNASPDVLRADVLKVPHHGSETASAPQFVAVVDPRFVIISASTVHHLPRDTVIQRYEETPRIILRTDEDDDRGNDHVICRPLDAELACNFERVFTGS